LLKTLLTAMAGVTNSVATTVYSIVGFPEATIEYNAGVIEVNGSIFSLTLRNRAFEFQVRG
jgi:hypothetical protein